MTKLYKVRTSYKNEEYPWTTSLREAEETFGYELENVDYDEIDTFDHIELVMFDLEQFDEFDFESDTYDYMNDTAVVIKSCKFAEDEEGFLTKEIMEEEK